MALPLPPSEPQDRFRATKRKLDDAFLELDNSVIAPEVAENPRPLKRSNTSRSIYSTLAKYGISARTHLPPSTPAVPPTGLTRPTPHLTAILNRATTRTKKIFSFRSDNPTSSLDSTLLSTAEYRPSSIASFLFRLSTFKLATYANKPPQIDAVAASKCGWTNDGKDRLVCGICNASWVVAGREGLSREAGNALVEKQRVSLVEAHKHGCPWRARQCDPSIYRIPLQSPAVIVRGIKATALILDSFLKNVATKHPLTQTQVSSINSTVQSYSVPTNSEEAVGQQLAQEPDSLSEAAILAALFGWSLVPPTTSQEPRRSSFSKHISTPSTPIRSSSVSRAATPSAASPIKFNIPMGLLNTRDTLLQCLLCQRRIGLWTFNSPSIPASSTNPESPAPSTPKKATQQRHFDLLREHRSYCPYVVRSTSIPVLPVSSTGVGGQTKISTTQDSIMEGWRAVLTSVLRYGLGQKSTPEPNVFVCADDSEKEPAEAMEVDGVKAMVAGVKSRGGRDLLSYVKNLLS